MFWDKKKSEESSLPDLPVDNSPPSMNDYHSNPSYSPDEEDSGIHSLPVFPNSKRNENFNQNMIKDAVENPEETEEEDYANPPQIPEQDDLTDEDYQELSEAPTMPRSPKVVEMQEWQPSQMQQQRQKPKIPSLPPMHAPEIMDKPLFIKLSKFKEARESLEIAKIKLGEIDELLATIKEVKVKEDQELSNWEKEIESIKARIETVNSEIFDKSI